MPTIHEPTAVTAEMKDAKKDYLDRHTPRVIAPARVAKGESFDVTVRMGSEYVHPDLPEHYIQSLQLYRGEKLLGGATYAPGANSAGRETPSGFQQATFRIALDANATLSAMSYCTMHGIWTSAAVVVEVE